MPLCGSATAADRARLDLHPAKTAKLRAGGKLDCTFRCPHGHRWTRVVVLAPPPPPPRTARRTALYWHYDADFVLLYVGISETPVQRGKQHASTSAWVRFAVHIKGVWFNTRALAEQAERHAIATEQPVFNIAHAGADGLRRAEAYLRTEEAKI